MGRKTQECSLCHYNNRTIYTVIAKDARPWTQSQISASLVHMRKKNIGLVFLIGKVLLIGKKGMNEVFVKI